MKAQVIQGKLLLKQDEAEKVTKGGIIVPDLSQEKPKQGTVVAVGPSTARMETLCEVGDRVLFRDHDGTPVNLGEDDETELSGEYILVNYSQVLIYNKK